MCTTFPAHSLHFPSTSSAQSMRVAPSHLQTSGRSLKPRCPPSLPLPHHPASLRGCLLKTASYMCGAWERCGSRLGPATAAPRPTLWQWRLARCWRIAGGLSRRWLASTSWWVAGESGWRAGWVVGWVDRLVGYRLGICCSPVAAYPSKRNADDVELACCPSCHTRRYWSSSQEGWQNAVL